MKIVRTGVRSVLKCSWTFLDVKLQHFGSERDIYIYIYIRTYLKSQLNTNMTELARFACSLIR